VWFQRFIEFRWSDSNPRYNTFKHFQILTIAEKTLNNWTAIADSHLIWVFSSLEGFLNMYSISRAALNSVLLLVGSLVTTGCNNAKESSAESQSFIMKGVQWSDGIAQVCWIAPGYAKRKEEMRDIVISNFNAKTNMKFLGFNDCVVDKPFVGIRVAISDVIAGDPRFAGLSNLGNSRFIDLLPDWEKKGKPQLELNKILFEINDPSVYLNTVLHEFGHAAGLRHEHERKDTPETCKEVLRTVCKAEVKEDSGKAMEEITKGKSVEVGSFDSFSIMNYCYGNYLRERKEIGSLSKDDIIGVNTLYPTSKYNLPEVVASEPSSVQPNSQISKPILEQAAKIQEVVVYCKKDLLTKCIVDFGGGAGCLSTDRGEQECAVANETGRFAVSVKSTSACIYSKTTAAEKATCIPKSGGFK
jgi:hypothetical protein